MTKSKPEQHFTLLSTLAANADLGQFTPEEIQVGISESQRAGEEFALFVRNGFRAQTGNFFRPTNELTLQIPALPRPTLAELQMDCPAIKYIERDTSPEGPVTLTLNTVLRPDEKSTTGAEYELRLEPHHKVLLGY